MKTTLQQSFDFSASVLYLVIEENLGIKKDVILSIDKTRTIADTRRVMAKILKSKFPRIKIETIGEAIGRKHPNVSIQLAKHETLFNSNKEYTDLFNMIETAFYDKIGYEDKTLANLNEMRKNLSLEINKVDSIIQELESEKVLQMAV